MSVLARLSNQRGITVAEVLVAAAILGLGLAAVMSVVPVASYGVQDGNQTSQATYLAQQRLEQVRNATWTGTTDCVGLSAPPTSAPTPSGGACALAVTFPDEATVAGFTQYARTVRISDCGLAANLAVCGDITSAALRLVTVTVRYRPLSAAGGSNANTSVTLEWLVAQRL
jgi:type II secretory pathway pseudopilin PulG